MATSMDTRVSSDSRAFCPSASRKGSVGRFKSELWRHPGSDGWHFVTLPPSVTDEVRARAAGLHRHFGSFPVEARIEAIEWRTSLFSDRKQDAYVLPVKAEVRRRANVSVGDLLDVEFDLLL
jgi:hypothetical protein